MPQLLQTNADFSPISLRYTATLRGVVSPQAGTPFSYAMVGSFDPEMLINLAASNPEGQFFGVVGNQELRDILRVNTSRFGLMNLSWLETQDKLPRHLDFFCFMSPDTRPDVDTRESIFNLAQNLLVPGGLFASRYQAYENADEILRFLAQEYAPEFSKEQEPALLDHIAKLGTRFFASNSNRARDLNNAKTQNNATAYFESLVNEGDAFSGTFLTMAGLLPRGFAYAGDADIGANYLELSAPQESHEPLLKSQSPLLYESLKDFALQRTVRNDIWVKTPVEQTLDKPALFGPYVFGITVDPQDLPSHLETVGGKSIDLSTTLFKNLIQLMDMLPLGIGDFLSHPLGKEQDPDDVLSALQILVATGIAQPMRSRYDSASTIDLTTPLPSGNILSFIKETTIDAPFLQIASTIAGRALSVPARDALVLQAISRVGLGNSAGALYNELQRLSEANPALASHVMNAPAPSKQMAQEMVQSVVKDSILKWYAYGLLAA